MKELSFAKNLTFYKCYQMNCIYITKGKPIISIGWKKKFFIFFFFYFYLITSFSLGFSLIP